MGALDVLDERGHAAQKRGGSVGWGDHRGPARGRHRAGELHTILGSFNRYEAKFCSGMEPVSRRPQVPQLMKGAEAEA